MSFHTYRQRKLRSMQPILTRTQIRELGKIMGFKHFRQSVEFFMDPVNYFKLSKVKMLEIHGYLLEKKITSEKCPTTHILQGDHSRVLVSILFPGYPIIKASERYYRDMRENRSTQAKIIDLAYDILPTTDKYERLEELFRTNVDWSQKSTVSIPLKLLNRARVVEGHASSQLNVRLFLYMWSYERLPWYPQSLTRLTVDGKSQPISETDRASLDFGFHHLDITEKSSAIEKANRRTQGNVELSFEFDQPPRVRHVSVCAVWEKTPEELTSQLYCQTASLYIGQAVERSAKKKSMEDQVQEKVIEALKHCNNQNDKLNLDKTQDLLFHCGDVFSEAWNSRDGDQPEDDEVLVAGNEYISVTDPILLSIIQHPARCVFCTHPSCFDAQVFFKFQVTSMQWQCPVCNIKIRGIQDLYIDYQTKVALKKYPNHDRLLKRKDDTYIPIEETLKEQTSSKRPYDVITLDDEETKKFKHS